MERFRARTLHITSRRMKNAGETETVVNMFLGDRSIVIGLGHGSFFA